MDFERWRRFQHVSIEERVPSWRNSISRSRTIRNNTVSGEKFSLIKIVKVMVEKDFVWLRKIPGKRSSQRIFIISLNWCQINNYKECQIGRTIKSPK
jgi:hypothetical protein